MLDGNVSREVDETGISGAMDSKPDFPKPDMGDESNGEKPRRKYTKRSARSERGGNVPKDKIDAVPESILIGSAVALSSVAIVLTDLMNRKIRHSPLIVSEPHRAALQDSMTELCRKYSTVLGAYGPEIGVAAAIYMLWIGQPTIAGNDVKSEK